MASRPTRPDVPSAADPLSPPCRPHRPGQLHTSLLPKPTALTVAAIMLLAACGNGPEPITPAGREKTVTPQTATAAAGLGVAPQQQARSLSMPESMPGPMPGPMPGSMVGPKARWATQPLPRPAPPAYPPPRDAERYQSIRGNPVQRVADAPVSTFSIDVDTGSWSNVRRFLNGGTLPRRDAVRVEEMVNYFPYDYARPTDGRPFAIHSALATAPWNLDRLLMRVAIKGEDRSLDQLPPANLVFLIDVSGSMRSADKLPLLKASLKLLAAKLRPEDRLSIVTYASGTAAPLVAVPGNDRARILQVIDGLQAAGSTAGASGIELAYRIARQSMIPGGINRILLATDGDFNVGVTDFDQLKQAVETRRADGISLSTLGFGTGNLNEHLMEQLADAGDGAYSYIDTLMEGHKVLVTEMSSTLATIARDVKIQVEFNPAVVSEYRLIGYENRLLAREDFNDDRVDAGDVGAGHTVTAIYELTPVGKAGSLEPLRYGRDGRNGRDAGATDAGAATASEATAGEAAAGHDSSDELAFVRIRYKGVDARASRLVEQPVAAGKAATMAEADVDFRFATAIAGFGQILRGGVRGAGDWTFADARALAAGSLGEDRFGHRAEALRLIDLAAALAGTTTPSM